MYESLIKNCSKFSVMKYKCHTHTGKIIKKLNEFLAQFNTDISIRVAFFNWSVSIEARINQIDYVGVSQEIGVKLSRNRRRACRTIADSAKPSATNNNASNYKPNFNRLITERQVALARSVINKHARTIGDR